MHQGPTYSWQVSQVLPENTPPIKLLSSALYPFPYMLLGGRWDVMKGLRLLQR